jgi:hypothetical protein
MSNPAQSLQQDDASERRDPARCSPSCPLLMGSQLFDGLPKYVLLQSVWPQGPARVARRMHAIEAVGKDAAEKVVQVPVGNKAKTAVSEPGELAIK